MKKLLLLALTVISAISLSFDLKTFNIREFDGKLPLISLETFVKNKNYTSVEGIVYEMPSEEKFRTKADVDQNLLSKEKIAGILVITIDELALYNGKKNTALVAVNGVVYDVSSSKLWRDGSHRNMHSAGQELTYEILKLSPHGPVKLDQMRPFGILVFTYTQLGKYGKDGTKNYVSAFGVVYDMADSKTVQKGVHFGYPMGSELTFEILQRPGHEDMLNRIYPVGLLVFSREDLKHFNGTKVKVISKDLMKSFVGINGIVYDVTGIDEWQQKIGVDSNYRTGMFYTISDFSPEEELTRVGFVIQ